MADPTNARTRTMETFFEGPRVPVKHLPHGEGDDRDEDRGPRAPGPELPWWNAYAGPPR